MYRYFAGNNTAAQRGNEGSHNSLEQFFSAVENSFAKKPEEIHEICPVSTAQFEEGIRDCYKNTRLRRANSNTAETTTLSISLWEANNEFLIMGEIITDEVGRNEFER